MDTRSKETEMINLVDRLSVEFTRYFFERNASSDYGVEAPFLILIFGFVAAIYADAELIDEREHDFFIARATDYIVVEGLGTRRRGIVITTPEYREKLYIVDALLKFADGWAEETLFITPDDDSFETNVSEWVHAFRAQFNKLAPSLKVPKIDETREAFMEKMYAELLKRHDGNQIP